MTSIQNLSGGQNPQMQSSQQGVGGQGGMHMLLQLLMKIFAQQSGQGGGSQGGGQPSSGGMGSGDSLSPASGGGGAGGGASGGAPGGQAGMPSAISGVPNSGNLDFTSGSGAGNRGALGHISASPGTGATDGGAGNLGASSGLSATGGTADPNLPATSGTASSGTGTNSGGTAIGGPASSYHGVKTDSTQGLQSMISPSALNGADPVPKNGGAQKQAPTPISAMGPASTEPNNAISQSGPLKGIPNGDAIAAAAQREGVSPYLLAGDAAVESGDNADNRIVNNANIKDGQNQVNSGVWNSPSNPEQNADMAAKLIKMYTKQAGGNVAQGLDGYNTGSVHQAGYAASANGGKFSSYAAGVNSATQNVINYEKSIGNYSGGNGLSTQTGGQGAGGGSASGGGAGTRAPEQSSGASHANGGGTHASTGASHASSGGGGGNGGGGGSAAQSSATS